MKWKSEQPKDGDSVILCGHDCKAMHWWKFENPMVFRRPDRTLGSALWLVACEECYLRHVDDPLRIPVRTDGVWQGDAPVIREGS